VWPDGFQVDQSDVIIDRVTEPKELALAAALEYEKRGQVSSLAFAYRGVIRNSLDSLINICRHVVMKFLVLPRKTSGLADFVTHP